MGRKRTPGLRYRNGIWHIEKQINGVQIFESTGTKSLKEAQAQLAKRIEEIRLARVYGVRPRRHWRDAATKYLEAHQHKASIADYAMHLQQLDPYIGNFRLDRVHDGSLLVFIQARQAAGIRSKSINLALEVVRRILNLAARSWRDDNGLTWLATAPAITMLPITDARQSYPLSWEEQARFFPLLPGHLERMALFKVNTGTREQEVCQLRWQWEETIPELGHSVFIIPDALVKNRRDWLVVLNDIASSVIDQCRGQHPAYVFTYRHRPVNRMNNTGWAKAWKKAGLPTGEAFTRGPHNLKHTFGRRLRAAGVSLETRKVLLGHWNRDITTHYSAPELQELVDAVNTVCRTKSGKTPALTLLKPKVYNPRQPSILNFKRKRSSRL
jgi:integrase